VEVEKGMYTFPQPLFVISNIIYVSDKGERKKKAKGKKVEKGKAGSSDTRRQIKTDVASGRYLYQLQLLVLINTSNIFQG
jgi:hypothetical protein